MHPVHPPFAGVDFDPNSEASKVMHALQDRAAPSPPLFAKLFSLVNTMGTSAFANSRCHMLYKLLLYS